MVERGEASADGFISEIGEMMSDLTANYKVVSGAEVLFPSGRDVIGKCPRCGSEVTESRKGFFCENHDCHFGMWRDNKFFKMKHMTLTKVQAAELLKSGRVFVKGLYSEKTGKLYDAWVVLDDNGEFVRYQTWSLKRGWYDRFNASGTGDDHSNVRSGRCWRASTPSISG